MKLYHTTTREVAEIILRDGFQYLQNDGGYAVGWVDNDDNEVPNPDPEHYPSCPDPIWFAAEPDDEMTQMMVSERHEDDDLVELVVDVPDDAVRYDPNLGGWSLDGSYEDWENHPWRVVSAADLAGLPGEVNG
jgi:hypothetical protein